MPAITRTETVERVVGMVCDRCGKIDEQGFNDFHATQRLGYDSVLDQGVLSFSLCDDCLVEIAAAHIPGAKLIDGGHEVPLAGPAARAAAKRRGTA